MNSQAKARVLVLGGGFAGLETAFHLRMRLGSRADITIVSDHDRFLFKPNSIYIPFGLNVEKLLIPIQPAAAKQNIRFVKTRALGVNPKANVAETEAGKLNYDYLVLATGSKMRPEEIPGLKEHAHSIFTPPEMSALGQDLAKLIEAAKGGKTGKILFLVPPNNKCSGPLYEMVFMTDHHLRRQRVRDKIEIHYATVEGGFIQAFGPRLNEYVQGRFDRLAIKGYLNHTLQSVEKDHVRFLGGKTLDYSLLITFPPYIAAHRFEGMPLDERGFIATELATRQVKGHPNIYAPGDTGDFPVKQAFLAFLEGDAVSGHITAQVTGRPAKNPFEPNSMCVMEEFSQATFASVPLRLTGDPAHPVEVRPDAYANYKLGSGGLWRIGKKMIGGYLGWRFRAGKPFHGGPPWAAMEAGLAVASRVMAK